MSAQPHSVTHAKNYVDPNGHSSRKEKRFSGKGSSGIIKNGITAGIVAPFQKMRRRLTVTGTSETIDGASKMAVSDSPQQKYHSAVRCAVTDYAGVSKKGHAPYNPRKKNQDALIMTDDAKTDSIILCVLDGHGEQGDAVSRHFRDCLAREMINHPCWATDIKKATSDAIAMVEDQILRNFRIDTEFSGTTLSMAIVRGNRITGVNIGDSRVTIKKGKNGDMMADEFTHDHKPDSPKEKARVLAAGGRVFAVEYEDGIDGPPRIWLGHADVPGLAMSRSLGDSVAHMAGVISQPEFTERDLDPSVDKAIIVATDGLWEFVSNQEAVDLESSTNSPSEAVEKLVREANARWMREEQVIDDTTIIVAHLFK